MKKCWMFLLCLVMTQAAFAQEDDLVSELDKEITDDNQTTATFKSTQIINIQSVETNHRGLLQFVIGHRFGRINQGVYELFGLDNSTIRLGLSYGITDKLTVGIGRSSLNKTLDGFVKWKLLAQKNDNSVPVTITGFASTSLTTLRFADPDRQDYFNGRLAYTSQLLIARKFSDKLSLQLTPSLVHINLVETTLEENNVFTVGIGGRYKITSRMAITGEYNYLLTGKHDFNANSLSLGIDLETGGHVFQLHFTNSQGLIDRFFLAETDGFWDKGDIYFGFNITRAFQIGNN